MSENQNMEYKESWRDEYLKWICGFANADGGILVIGRNDHGDVVGVHDAAKLMEDIPNKVRDILGLIVAVSLHEEHGAEYLEIAVDPYPYPISHKGKYYQRSGSTNQELTGAPLDRFLMRKQGLHWDGAPMPGVLAVDLSADTIAAFKNMARESQRLDASVLAETTPDLLAKLNLLDRKHLKRAAILLFHPQPERLISGAFVKIGYFRTESDLLYHDEIHGNLFAQARQTLDLLLSKYLKAAIGYRGVQRTETLPVPVAALREVLFNALIHKDYACPSPIQIRVYADRLKIWNPGELPEHWSADVLVGEHASRPHNPCLANVFFRAGEIEAWGRGIQRIFDACHDAGTPAPIIRYQPGDLWVEFPFSTSYLTRMKQESNTTPVETLVETLVETPQRLSTKTPDRILNVLAEHPTMTLAEVATAIGMSVSAVERAAKRLTDEGRLRHEGPRKGGRWNVTP